jgi:hypothetical protein
VRRIATGAAAVVLAAAWLVVTAPAGSAAGALQLAWWWQAQSAPGALPPPPTVPDGGLWVSSNAAGPQAVSAIRVPLGPGEAAPILTLTLHQATPPTPGGLAAYPTTAAWTPGPAQAWSSKPAYDPTGVAAAGELSADGKQVKFDLSGLVAGDQLNVVLAPAPAATPPPPPVPSPPAAPPTFDVTFEKPGAEAFHVSGAPIAAGAAAPEQTPTAAPSDLGSAPDALTPALPSGLMAPLSSALPSSPPAVAANRPVALANAPRRLLPVSTRRSFANSAAIAAMLGIVLLWLAREGGPRPGGQRRPRLSLYDAPKRAEALAPVHTGSPPPLR